MSICDPLYEVRDHLFSKKDQKGCIEFKPVTLSTTLGLSQDIVEASKDFLISMNQIVPVDASNMMMVNPAISYVGEAAKQSPLMEVYIARKEANKLHLEQTPKDVSNGSEAVYNVKVGKVLGYLEDNCNQDNTILIDEADLATDLDIPVEEVHRIFCTLLNKNTVCSIVQNVDLTLYMLNPDQCIDSTSHDSDMVQGIYDEIRAIDKYAEERVIDAK